MATSDSWYYDLLEEAYRGARQSIIEEATADLRSELSEATKEIESLRADLAAAKETLRLERSKTIAERLDEALDVHVRYITVEGLERIRDHIPGYCDVSLDDLGLGDLVCEDLEVRCDSAADASHTKHFLRRVVTFNLGV